MSRYTFGGEKEKVGDPGNDGFAVVPSDDTPLSEVPKYLYVGTGGDVAVQGREGGDILMHRNVPSGGYVAFRPRYVRATGTTAGDILAIT